MAVIDYTCITYLSEYSKSIRLHANMYEHVMVETLSETFNAILGGNVYNVMLHVNAATLRGLTSFILCLI